MIHCIDHKCYYLTDLFHYDYSQKKYIHLKKGLEEYQFLLFNAYNAVENLLNGDFEKFDSLVGENSCQIRAIKIALIASHDLTYLQCLAQRLTKALTKLKELMLPSSINIFMHEGHSLKDIIDKDEINIYLNEDEMFVIQSYLLSEMKDNKSHGKLLTSILRDERCSPNRLQKQYPQISCAFLDKLSKKLRQQLSIASVDFVRKAAFTLKDLSLIKMLSDDFIYEHNKLYCVPTFWSFKTLFTLAQHSKIVLVMHVKFLDKLDSRYRVIDEEFLYFKYNEKTHSYLEVKLSNEDLTLPACIIQGVICPGEDGTLLTKQVWKKIIKKRSIVEMLLAMGADHRQYPNPDKIILVHDEEYKHYKNLAVIEGFSLNNPTTFFVQHIYCSQIQRLSKNNFNLSLTEPYGTAV